MEIPRGFGQFDAVRPLAVAERAARESVDRERQEWGATLDAATGAARTWGRIREDERIASEEVERQREQIRARRNDAQVRLVAARASAEFEQRTAGRAIADEDLDWFESRFMEGVADLDLTDDEREIVSMVGQQYRATAAEAAVKYNLGIEHAKLKDDTFNAVNELVDSGRFEDAAAVLETNADLYTPAQLDDARTKIVSTREHTAVTRMLGGGTEAEIEQTRNYIDSVLTGDAVPASMRDSLHASLTRLVNRVESRNKQEETEFKKAQEEAKTEFVGLLKMQARFGVEDEDGTKLFLSRDQVEDLYGKELIGNAERYELTRLIEAREKQDADLNSDLELMSGAIGGGDPTAAFRAKNATKTATQTVNDTMPSMAKYHTSAWKQEDKARLFALVENNWEPKQVTQTLTAGQASMNPELVASGVALWKDLTVRVPEYANRLPEDVRAYYNTMAAFEAAGMPINQAVAEMRERRSRATDIRVLEQRYKDTGTTIEQNARDLIKRFGDDDAMVAAAPGGVGLFDSPSVRTALANQFDTLVRHYYVKTENLDAARETAYQTISNTVRPTRFNGVLELMPTPPELPKGTNKPLDTDLLRAEFDEWAKSDLPALGEGETLAVYPVEGVTVEGAQVYYVRKRPAGSEPTSMGEVVVDGDGNPVYWRPDLGDYKARHDKKLADAITPLDDAARAREGMEREARKAGRIRTMGSRGI